MATLATIFYGSFPSKAHNKEVDLNDGSFKVALFTSAYQPQPDVHAYFSHLSGEAIGVGYTAGGTQVSAITGGGVGLPLTFGVTDAEWLDSTITARYAVLYDDTPALASAKVLICYADFGQDRSSAAGPFIVMWETGVFNSVLISGTN